MKVTAVETLTDPRHAEFLWVRVETDEGVAGTGETMPKPLAVETAIHEKLAPLLIGTEVAPEVFWETAFRALAYTGYSGAEMRALSAIDLALWDALSRFHQVDLVTMLGGASRSTVDVYNTCVGFGKWDDHNAFLHHPGDLAQELVDEGYTAMKIWPFDAYSTRSGGHSIQRDDLLQGTRVIAEIRERVGMDIDIAIEGHSCWDLPTAIKIAHEIEPFAPSWIEDLIQARNPSTWRQLRESTGVPVCGSERVFTRFDALPYLEQQAWDIVNQDVAWTGGISELRKVAALADAFDRPITLHNCHGPVSASATILLGTVIPNLSIVETVRSFERGIHSDIADTAGYAVANGVATPSGAYGLGVELGSIFLENARRRRTDASDVPAATGWAAGDPWAAGVDEGM